VSPPVPHEPAAVWHPRVSLHNAVQHWSPTPTPQVVIDAVQEQVLHTSPVPLQ
jgi:hypothetical protein